MEAVRVARVVLVSPVRDHARRRRDRKKSFHRAGRLERGLEVRDVALDLGLAGVPDRRHAHRLVGRRAGRGGRTARRIELGVKLGEARAVGAARKRMGAGLHLPALEAAQALERVLRPADRLAEFAVARRVYAELGLPPHNLGN